MVRREIEKAFNYILSEEFWGGLTTVVIKILIILVLGYFIIKIAKKIVTRVFSKDRRTAIRISERREETLKKLIQNAIVYTVYIIGILTILQTVGIEIGPLLAGAGIAGLAIGFGAQSLVKDIISGFFIVFEDQFAVGDYVFVSEVEGTVEEIGLRTTKIKDITGERYIVPNGNITQVTNYSIHNGISVIDVNVPYESSVKEAKNIIEEISSDVFQSSDVFLMKPEIIGVQNLELSHFTIRVTGETKPGEQWNGARLLREEIKMGLYSRGIDIPAPRLVVYSKKNENSINKEETK